jgi:hypothetical protein
MRAQRQTTRTWTEQDDAMLEAILAMGRIWADRGGRVSLAALELDTRLVTFVVSGLCPRHGQFVADWTGRYTDPVPMEARCPAAETGRCWETSPVYVLV